MRRQFRTAALLAAIVPLAANAVELVMNGGFESGLSGWIWTGLPSYTESCNVAAGYHPDPDNELCLYKYDATGTMLYQTVNVTTTRLTCRFSAALQAVELNPSQPYFAIAAVAIEYRDINENYLGRTVYAYKTAHAAVELPGSSTQRVVSVSDNLWHDYEANLQTELAALPGINPNSVRRLRMVAFDTTNGC
jgi:hypothetical protein